jgi:nucleoside-diphosphate-sugar epimerase
VIATARSDASARAAAGLGARVMRADIFARDTLTPAMAGAEVVMHLATSIPRTFPGKPQEFALNDRIRREGTRNLLDAAREAGVARVIGQSIVWVHGDQRGAWIDESAPVKPARLTQSAVEMEDQFRRYADAVQGQVHVLRCGSLYAAESWHTRELIDRLKKRLAPIIGRGENYQCFLHAADAAAAFAAALDPSVPGGTWLVTDDEPVMLGEYLRWVARSTGAPEPMQIPPFMARVALGSDMLEAFTSSMRCRNDRFKAAFGWKPRYPGYRDGYAEILPRL